MNAKIRYYLDENVNPAVADGLRLRGIDVITTVEAGMLSATDIEHVVLANSLGRVIFTQDRDFLRLHSQGLSHPGIVFFANQKDIGRIVRGLQRLFERSTAEQMQNSVVYL